MGYKLGFLNQYKFVEKDEEGGEHEITVHYRLPTTRERVQFLIDASRISVSLKQEDREASLIQGAEMQTKYALMIIEKVDGLEVPEGQDPVRLFCENMVDRLGTLLGRVYNQGKEVETVEGKSVAE